MTTENMRKLVNVITVECTAGYIYCTVILRPICYFFSPLLCRSEVFTVSYYMHRKHFLGYSEYDL